MNHLSYYCQFCRVATIPLANLCSLSILKRIFKMKRAFVTGATGFVGANLVRQLLQKHYDVHIVVRNKNHFWRIQDIIEKLHIYSNDLSNLSSLEKLIKKISPNHIFHLAAYGAYSSQNNMQKAIQTNIIGLQNLLLASKDVPYESFINTGSSSEYGWKNKPMEEADSLEPISYYAATKATASYLCQVFAKTNNKPISTFRLFSVYGPFEEPTRFIPTAMKAALTNTPLSLTPGKIARDFIYIDDVIDAYIQVSKKGIGNGEVFNIGTGKQSTNQKVASIIKKCHNNSLLIEKGMFPARSWDTNFWVANTNKTKKMLNWQPRYILEDGLKNTYDWFSKNLSLYK